MLLVFLVALLNLLKAERGRKWRRSRRRRGRRTGGGSTATTTKTPPLLDALRGSNPPFPVSVNNYSIISLSIISLAHMPSEYHMYLCDNFEIDETILLLCMLLTDFIREIEHGEK